MQNKNNSFFLGICLLIFFAGAFFGSFTDTIPKLGVFVSKIGGDEIATFATILGGFSSFVAVIYAVYIYLFDWHNRKQQLYIDDLLQKLQEAVVFCHFITNIYGKNQEDEGKNEFIRSRRRVYENLALLVSNISDNRVTVDQLTDTVYSTLKSISDFKDGITADPVVKFNEDFRKFCIKEAFKKRQN